MKAYAIEFDNYRYIVTVYYDGGPIPWQKAYFYRDERKAVKRMARFIQDNAR